MLDANADIALLQEVGRIPQTIRRCFTGALARRATGKIGLPQRFSTVVLTKFPMFGDLRLHCEDDWVNEQGAFFGGNLVAVRVAVSGGSPLNVVSVYSPAWPIARETYAGVDVTRLKLAVNPDIWCTDILWYLLLHTIPATPGQWVIGGDFNSSETLDFGPKGDRGNREIMNRMMNLGLTEVLRRHNGGLVPTFRQLRGTVNGAVLHQLDHIYVSNSLAQRLLRCYVGAQDAVFGMNLSDHLPVIAEFT